MSTLEARLSLSLSLILKNSHRCLKFLKSKKFFLMQRPFSRYAIEEEKGYGGKNLRLQKHNSNLFKDENLISSYERSTLFEHVSNLNYGTLLMLYLFFS